MTQKTSDDSGFSIGVALVVAGAFFMQGLDAAILNTSLPQIARDLHVAAVQMNQGITAYILALAIFTPISAWLADRLGAKIVFVAAVAVFTGASVACAAATSLPAFLVARIAQGIGGAVLGPVGRMVVLSNTSQSNLMRATALLTWPGLFAPVVGPVIGGTITQLVGWRWNFLLNLPLGVIGLAFAVALVPNVRERLQRPLDAVGAVLSGSGLFLLIFALGRFSASEGTQLSVALFLMGVVLTSAAVFWFQHHKHPLLDLASLRIRTFAVSTAEAGGLAWIAVSATPFLLPLMMQAAWGFDPIHAGAWLFVYFLGNLVMKTVTTQVLRSWGFRNVMTINGVGIGITVALCGFMSPHTPAPALAFVLFAAGATRSMQLTALSTLAFADVPGPRRSSASTLFSVLQQLASTVGIALAAVLLNAAKTSHGGVGLSQEDFRLAFLSCGALAGLGGILSLRLHQRAGSEVSGHGAVRQA